MAATEEQRLEAWASYREKLGQPLDSPDFDKDFQQSILAEVAKMETQSDDQVEEVLDSKISVGDVNRALTNASNGKACGGDRTRNEMFKYGGDWMAPLLARYFSRLFAFESSPTEWGRGVLTNLFKDGDPADLGNYRRHCLDELPGEAVSLCPSTSGVYFCGGPHIGGTGGL